MRITVLAVWIAAALLGAPALADNNPASVAPASQRIRGKIDAGRQRW